MERLFGTLWPEALEEEESHRIRLLLGAGFIIGAVGSLFLIVQLMSFVLPFMSPAPWADIGLDMAAVFTGGLTVWCARSGHARSAAWSVIICLLAVATMMFYLEGQPPASVAEMLALLVAVVLAMVLLEPRSAWTVFATAGAIYAGMHLLWLDGHLPQHVERTLSSQAIFAVLAWLACTGIVVVVINSTMSVLRRQAQALQWRIAEQERVKQTLIESEERFRRMANGIQDGLTIIERGKVVYVNDRACEIFGYPRDELVELSGLDVAAPEEKERLRRLMVEVEQKGIALEEVEFWVLGKDGARRCVHNRYSFSREGDKIIGRYVITSDITERVQAEERLRLLSSAVEQSTEGIAVVDLEGDLLFTNEAFAAMHGYTVKELAGKHLSIFHTPEQMPAVETANQQIQETGSFSGEIWHARRNGTIFPTLMNNSLLRDETGSPLGMIGTLRDITERKQMEEALQESQQLQAAFIQNVSHELRTPLAIAYGYAELLDDGTLGQLRPEQQEPVSIIARRLRMLGKLVDDITAILEAETQDLQREPVDLADLVLKAVDHFQVIAEQHRLVLKAKVVSGLPPVFGDVTYLYRVLDNLLSNAVKFTPANGRIAVQLRQSGSNVVLEVTDTGVGISLDQQERIFERFYQVDGSIRRRYGGVGLGLALVKEIVETLGGRVSVQSEVNQGSTFTVTLPAYDG